MSESLQGLREKLEGRGKPIITDEEALGRLGMLSGGTVIIATGDIKTGAEGKAWHAVCAAANRTFEDKNIRAYAQLCLRALEEAAQDVDFQTEIRANPEILEAVSSAIADVQRLQEVIPGDILEQQSGQVDHVSRFERIFNDRIIVALSNLLEKEKSAK